jgi:hypothetical protein
MISLCGDIRNSFLPNSRSRSLTSKTNSGTRRSQPAQRPAFGQRVRRPCQRLPVYSKSRDCALAPAKNIRLRLFILCCSALALAVPGALIRSPRRPARAACRALSVRARRLSDHGICECCVTPGDSGREAYTAIAERRKRRGLGKPETFNFLGFTFICGTSSGGQFQIKRKTRRDRMRAKLKEVKEEMRQRRHHSIPEQGHWLKQVVSGSAW